MGGSHHCVGDADQAWIAPLLDWLRAHQDRETGSWAAESMNHPHDRGSIPEFFMRDAATGFATLALLAPEMSARR